MDKVLELLGKVLDQQEEILEQLADLTEQQKELREAISNLSLPGRDYSIDEFPEY